MLRLKEKKAAPVEEPAPATTDAAPAPAEAKDGGETAAASASGTISLLGVGGTALRSGEEKRGGKKRTPGEIRIQKGTHLVLI